MKKRDFEDTYLDYVWNNAGSTERSYLSHHGILGQKWGVRRFQNKDGSYTAEGKKRYGFDTEVRNHAENLIKDEHELKKIGFNEYMKDWENRRERQERDLKYIRENDQYLAKHLKEADKIAKRLNDPVTEEEEEKISKKVNDIMAGCFNRYEQLLKQAGADEKTISSMMWSMIDEDLWLRVENFGY